MGVVEALVFIEMSIDLLNLGHFPAEMLLRLRKSIVSLTCLHLGISLQRNLPSVTIELFALSLLGLGIVIFCFVAIVLLPSLRLSRRHDRRLLCENATLVILVHQFIEKQPRRSHILRFIKHLETACLTLRLTFATSASCIAASIFVTV